MFRQLFQTSYQQMIWSFLDISKHVPWAVTDMISEHVGGLVGCGDGVVWVGFGEVVVSGFLLVVWIVLGHVLLVEEHGARHETQHDDRYTEHQQHRVTATKTSQIKEYLVLNLISLQIFVKYHSSAFVYVYIATAETHL